MIIDSKDSLKNKLEKLEIKFGGLSKNVFSNYTKEDLEVEPYNHRMSNINQGGDRFSGIGYYGEIYSKYVFDFINKKINICEIGILKGTGLAVWDEVFNNENTKILGLDIDVGNFLGNFENIKKQGGFKSTKKVNTDIEEFNNSRISCFKFDQYNIEVNKNFIPKVLKENKIDIIIDDGDHQDKPNILTAQVFKPYLNDGAIYFLEDVKPRRVENLIKIFSDLGYNLIDHTRYPDNRIGGMLVFKYSDGK